ncbi:MAG: PKD domain-containing protein, partial [Deltaproteobacteria bacterium]|nr:PKD domain-containing protein [Deltaproteobacteria bacterium]
TADSVCYGSPTTLTDASNLNGNPLFIFSWDFNADNISDLSNNSLSSTHTFTNWGNNSVIYTAFTSPNGGMLTCSDKITKNVWVHPIPNAFINYTNKCVDLQPNLMNGGNSSVSVGSIVNYAWDYGNGNTNLLNPGASTSYSYNVVGNYVVTLTVTTAAGCTNTFSQTVEVWERPYANFSYSKVCAGKQTVLKGNQLPPSAPIAIYQWDFNNSVTSIEATGAQVTYTFNAGGLTPVNLLVTSDKGCTNTIPGNVYINYNPKPNFYAPKRAGCADLCISILDSTQVLTGPAKVANWEWSFGNNLYNNSNQPNTQFSCYTNSSNLSTKDYSLKLIVRTDSGCVDSVIKNKYVRVYPKPVADFQWKGQDGNLLTPVIAFQNTSIGYSSFSWYYNDGVNITDSVNQNPVHYYKTDIARNFNVFLAVRNQYGCKDTISKLVDIGPEFTFYIPNTFTPNGDGNNETFTGNGIGIKAYKMWIYDRWGEKLYYTEDINKGWDASIKGKHDVEKMDVFTYKVIVTDLWNKEHEYVGHVTLLK